MDLMDLLESHLKMLSRRSEHTDKDSSRGALILQQLCAVSDAKGTTNSPAAGTP